MILLFGADGFVGRHVLAEFGAHPDVLDDVLAVSRERIDLAACASGDLVALLREAPPRAVVNCVGATTGDATTLTRSNVVAVARLLSAMAAAAPQARLVHLGSATEYGATPMGPPITERAPCHPASDQGLTKLAGTELVRAAAADGLDAVVLRPFNVIGPGARESSLPGLLARNLREGGDLVVGGLEVYRDFVDVRDVARAVAAAVTAAERPPAVLNVGSGRATAVRDLISTLVEIAGPGTRVVPGARRPPAVPWQCADLTAIGEALGWRPEIDLRTSLTDLWETL